MIYDPEDPFVPTGQADDAKLSLSPEDQWRGERLMIVVDFDGEGKVKWAFGLRPARSGWYRMLQRWLPSSLSEIRRLSGAELALHR